MQRTLFKALASVALLAGLAVADEVVLIPKSTVNAAGGLLRGPITSETPTDVKIRAAAGDQTVPLDQIASITYDGVPATYNLAELSVKQGQLEQAADQFKKAAAEASGKPLIAQAALFRRAEILSDAAMASPAKLNEAIGELDDFVKKYPTSRHLSPALETLIRLHLQKGDTARADAVLATLGERIPSAVDRAAVLKARVQSKSGKSDQAIAGLDKIIAANKGPVPVREAKLVKSECLVAMSKFDDCARARARSHQGGPARGRGRAGGRLQHAGRLLHRRCAAPRTRSRRTSTPTSSTTRTRKSIPGRLRTSSSSSGTSSKTAAPRKSASDCGRSIRKAHGPRARRRNDCTRSADES